MQKSQWENVVTMFLGRMCGSGGVYIRGFAFIIFLTSCGGTDSIVENITKEHLDHFDDLVFLENEDGSRFDYVKKWNGPLLVSLRGEWDDVSENFLKDLAENIERQANVEIRFDDSSPNVIFSMESSAMLAAQKNISHLRESLVSRESLESALRTFRKGETICWARGLAEHLLINKGYAFVYKDMYGDQKKHCISLSFMGILGLNAVLDEVRDSVFYYESMKVEPTQLDYDVLKMLYCNEIKIGMKRNETLRFFGK
jgi:hypothetical protein